MNKLKKFLDTESLSSLFLFIGAILALIVSNSSLNDYYVSMIRLPISFSVGSVTLSKPLLKWVNDGLMAFFFLMLTLEAKNHLREGDLVDKNFLKLAFVAAVSGAVVPALLYFWINQDQPESIRGWAIPIATDTAFVLGIISLFKQKVPFKARLFVLWLSVMDDVCAVLVIALFYTPSLNAGMLGYALLIMIFLAFLNTLRIRALWVYLTLGLGLWITVVEAGIHGTLAGVILASFIPSTSSKSDPHAESPIKQLERKLHPFVVFVVLPIFAFLNCEIRFEEISFADLTSTVTLGIVIGLFVGKQFGIFLSSYVYAKVARIHLPFGLSWDCITPYQRWLVLALHLAFSLVFYPLSLKPCSIK